MSEARSESNGDNMSQVPTTLPPRQSGAISGFFSRLRRGRSYDRIRQLESRTAMTACMLRTLDPDEIGAIFLGGLVQEPGLGFGRACLFLTDETGRAVRLHSARLADPTQSPPPDDRREGDLAGQLKGFRLAWQELSLVAARTWQPSERGRTPLGAALARCLLEHSSLSSNKRQLYHEPDESAHGGVQFSRFSLVPLVVDERVLGAVLADSPTGGGLVTRQQIAELEALAELAAVAIDRAQTHRQMVALAELDPLTRIHNRRFLGTELRRFLDVCRHTGRPLSMILIDLDEFKSYNDTHGHWVGDRILQDVARLLKEQSRLADVVGRFGGDEFAMLLPDTGPEGAIQVAARLRERLEREPLVLGQIRGLTLSAGVATSREGETPESLYQRADRALYDAKCSGRNAVAASGDRSSGFVARVLCLSEFQKGEKAG